MQSIDEKARTLWEKARYSVTNYNAYLGQKSEANKFKLSIVDLLFVSNFKAGNGSIQEDFKSINAKLISYSESLHTIDEAFAGKHLQDISQDELKLLLKSVKELIGLCKVNQFRIDGFGVLYCSALLHLYFPDLIPILDRRVLIGTGIVNNLDQITSQNQIKNIELYFGNLIVHLRKDLKNKKFSTIDEADKAYFILKIPDTLKK